LAYDIPEPDSLMTKPCMRKKGSGPPVCEVHNVQLVRKELPVEMNLSGYTSFTFLVCPVTGTVLDDEKHMIRRSPSRHWDSYKAGLACADRY
jgi:hypothetical protein